MNTFSNVKLRLFNGKGNMKAAGSVVVAGVAEVHFTVVQSSKGIFASLPSQKGSKPDENGKPIYYPLVSIPDKTQYIEFQKLVKQEYEKLLSGNQDVSASNGEDSQVDNYPF